MRGLRTGAVGLMVSTGATLGLVGCTEGRTVRYQLGQEAIVPSPELCEAVDHVAHQSLGKRTLGEVIESPELVTAAFGARALQEVCASTESIKHLAAGQAVVGKSYKAIKLYTPVMLNSVPPRQ
jgi:hypothetical protein